jgi:hypothetical protein
VRRTLGRPSLKSKESTVSVNRHGSLSNASTSGNLTLIVTFLFFFFNFYLEHDRRLRHPSDDVLDTCLKDVIKISGQAPVRLPWTNVQTHLLCHPREKFLLLVEELVDSRLPIYICVTSRPEPDMKAVLDPLIFRSASVHDESGQMGDIDYYCSGAIASS